jgi:hypothetical protein
MGFCMRCSIRGSMCDDSLGSSVAHSCVCICGRVCVWCGDDYLGKNSGYPPLDSCYSRQQLKSNCLLFKQV